MTDTGHVESIIEKSSNTTKQDFFLVNQFNNASMSVGPLFTSIFVLYFLFFNLLGCVPWGSIGKSLIHFLLLHLHLLMIQYIFIHPLHIPPQQRRYFQKQVNQGHLYIHHIHRLNKRTGIHAQEDTLVTKGLFQLSIIYSKSRKSWKGTKEKSFLILQAF